MYTTKSNSYTRHIVETLVILVTLCLWSCKEEIDKADIVRLDQIISEYPSMDYQKRLSTLDSLRPEFDAYFTVLGYDDVSTGMVEDWSETPVVKVFQPAIDTVYCDNEYLQWQLSHIADRALNDSLWVTAPVFTTVAWGKPNPIVRVDSILLIALNHYLGRDYPGYSTLPEYRKANKTPEQLPYDVAAVMAATEYKYVDTGASTLLSWMLYEGALVEARMRLVYNATLAGALGYSDEEIAVADKGCKAIWHEMSIQKVIYDTNPTTIDRYISAAPSSPVLQGNAPGKIGRYIGYRIVEAYQQKHGKKRLSQLLSPAFYDNPKTLIDSGFSPR